MKRILILLAACGPSATHPVENTGGGHAAPAACPADFTETARAAWGVGAGTPTATCLALHANGEDLWLIDGWFEPDPPDEDYHVGQYSAIVTPAGAVRWEDGEDDLPSGAMDKSATDEYEAVDFDGDGNDEVVYVVSYDHGGYTSSQLVAGKIDGKGQLTITGDGVFLDSDDSAADVDPADVYTCSAAHEVIDGPHGTHEIEVDASRDAGTDGSCLTPGKHVFRWDGEKLVEVKTP